MDKTRLNIAILGTRGIPNRYGGFEACAEQLAIRFTQMGHAVSVYCGHGHEVEEEAWNGIRRIMKWNPEHIMGTFGQFIYDLKCNLDSRKRDFDIILHMGYTSDSIWYNLWTGNSLHLVNMDGMEWQRKKYGRLTRRFLKWAERLATYRADILIADNPAIEEYLEGRYKNPIQMIPYGAIIPQGFSREVLSTYGLKPGSYDIIVARMEPENHIQEAIEAKLNSGDIKPLVITGNQNAYASLLQKEYASADIIIFTGPIYNQEALNSLRHFSRFYIHGHSVGGTNPSLLEAMACGCRIIAHRNPFNSAVIGKNAKYFSAQEELRKHLSSGPSDQEQDQVKVNTEKVKSVYNWEHIAHEYEKLIKHAIDNS